MDKTGKHGGDSAKLPFAIDRNGRANLPEQVAEGFRKAIRSGHYKPGDILPSREKIAQVLGISLRIPREAIAILANENLVRPRRGVGCTVLARRETLWKGRVLLVERHTSEGSYFCGTMMAEVRRCLSRAGYLYSCVTVDMKPRCKYACNVKPLREELHNQYDLALAVYPDKTMTRLLREALPTILVDGMEPDAETICTGGGSVPDEMLARCRETGAYRILYAGYDNCANEVRRLRRMGFKVEYLPVNLDGRTESLENLERGAFETYSTRFAKPLPELIYFGDDYVARGGLTALLALGIHVPDDVKVVTLSNKGFAPVFPVSLTQYEHDPVAFGEYVAERIIAKHEGRTVTHSPVFRRYIPGDSFP